MNKIASYLQTHLSGEVLDSASIREYFSTDASILEIKPTMVVYPRTTNDVRKVARFAWQLAEKGHILPITPRGSGTDQTGAAIGKGVVMVFPAHMNKILELDSQQKLVRIQPGLNFKSLQETLYTHGLFLPPFPASYKYSTIGGAIANNTSGEKSLKYGAMSDWVEKLEVVLANGELIQTGRIGKKEVEKKKGLTTLEGELYRVVDAVAHDNEELLDTYYDKLRVTKDSIGYDLRDVVRRDGSIDLTPLFVGSQGTLGIITEAIIKVAPYTPQNDLIVASFEKTEQALAVLDDLRDLEPSALEMIDHNLIDFARKQQNLPFPSELVGDTTPEAMLFIEFDDIASRARMRKIKRTERILETVTEKIMITAALETKEKLWALRHSAATVINYQSGGKTAVPVIEDAVVPPSKLSDLFGVLSDLFAKHHLSLAVWGHAGDANLHVQPLLDLSKVGDRQTAFRLMDEYYREVVALGGSIAAEHNEGRIRVPFVKLQTGEELYSAFVQLKEGFDKFGILNPGVKTGTEVKQLIEMSRKEYSLAHLADHLPRT
jgi:FAD/FMN-containing dehydrogenase